MSRSTSQARAAGPTNPSASHASRAVAPTPSSRARTDSFPKNNSAPERLDRPAEGFGVTDHRIAGDRLRHRHRALDRRPLDQALDAAVLVPEHDLQEQHFLAVRLEAKMAGLDDPGVDRPDRHLVHL